MTGIKTPDICRGGEDQRHFLGVANLIGVGRGKNFPVGINANGAGELRAFFWFVGVSFRGQGSAVENNRVGDVWVERTGGVN